jgi:predicted nucleotidyltransferase
MAKPKSPNKRKDTPSNDATAVFQRRIEYSRMRLEQLKNRIGSLDEFKGYPKLMAYAAGSFGRLEASKYSDIDVFLVYNGAEKDVEEPRTKSLRLFGKLIDLADELDFEKFSNDCQYLEILHSDEILHALGSPTDDHRNYFTARMLLMLESQCLYGKDVYEDIVARIVNSYFTDFPDHKETFQPIFLLNDICRFWKTMLLNYEHKRRQPPGSKPDEARKRRQKVRNFKLKFSRMTTCFATIAALGSYSAPVKEPKVIELISQTPHDRLLSIPERISSTKQALASVLEEYAWFLEMTGKPTEELEEHFSDKQKRTQMFQRANG